MILHARELGEGSHKSGFVDAYAKLDAFNPYNFNEVLSLITWYIIIN
jgi:hypothetical protein